MRRLERPACHGRGGVIGSEKFAWDPFCLYRVVRHLDSCSFASFGYFGLLSLLVLLFSYVHPFVMVGRRSSFGCPAVVNRMSGLLVALRP